MPTFGGPGADDWLVTITNGPNFRAFMPGTSPQSPNARYKIDKEGWDVWTARIDGTPRTIISAPGVKDEYFARLSNQTSAMGGGGSGGSRGGGGAQAMHATQVGQPQITGGGQGFSIGATNVGLILPSRSDEWKGVDTVSPDTKQRDTSPRAQNFDAFGKIGSRCIRRGIGKLSEDISTLKDGATASATITCIAKASFTASTDYIIFRIANGTTHAFWFDTTGADSEPGGSAAADASTTVDISGDTTAADVSDALTTAINGASIGITATDNSGSVGLAVAASGYLFWNEESVTNASFAMTQFSIAGSSVNSDYRGLSLLPVPCSGTTADRMLVCLHDTDVEIGSSTSGQQPTYLALVTMDVVTPRPKSLVGCPGPSITLSDQGSQTLRVTAVYTNLFPAAQAEQMEASVIGIIIRIVQNVSGATPRYPLDPDGEDGTGSTFFSVSGTDQNRVAWNGSSVTKDMTVTAGKAWVAVWGVGRDGLSEPSFASLTVA